jgi:hypothetical protein
LNAAVAFDVPEDIAAQFLSAGAERAAMLRSRRAARSVTARTDCFWCEHVNARAERESASSVELRGEMFSCSLELIRLLNPCSVRLSAFRSLGLFCSADCFYFVRVGSLDYIFFFICCSFRFVLVA